MKKVKRLLTILMMGLISLCPYFFQHIYSQEYVAIAEKLILDLIETEKGISQLEGISIKLNKDISDFSIYTSTYPKKSLIISSSFLRRLHNYHWINVFVEEIDSLYTPLTYIYRNHYRLFSSNNTLGKLLNKLKKENNVDKNEVNRRFKRSIEFIVYHEIYHLIKKHGKKRNSYKRRLNRISLKRGKTEKRVDKLRDRLSKLEHESDEYAIEKLIALNRPIEDVKHYLTGLELFVGGNLNEQLTSEFVYTSEVLRSMQILEFSARKYECNYNYDKNCEWVTDKALEYSFLFLVLLYIDKLKPNISSADYISNMSEFDKSILFDVMLQETDDEQEIYLIINQIYKFVSSMSVETYSEQWEYLCVIAGIYSNNFLKDRNFSTKCFHIAQKNHSFGSLKFYEELININ